MGPPGRGSVSTCVQSVVFMWKETVDYPKGGVDAAVGTLDAGTAIAYSG